MSHCRSNAEYQPKKTSYRKPSTREEFERLTYSERMQLLHDDPIAYERFTTPRKPWEHR